MHDEWQARAITILTVLGLLVLTTVFGAESAGLWGWIALGGGILLSLAGSMVWLLDGAPGGAV